MPSQPRGPELFIGLVGAVGTDLHLLRDKLEQALQAVGYRVHTIRLSSLLREIEGSEALTKVPWDEYVLTHQAAGNSFRGNLKQGDALATLSLADIQIIRESYTGDPKIPANRVAYIIRSLKHPDELTTLRRIYGPYFLSVAAYSARDSRRLAVARKIADSHHSTRHSDFLDKAQTLIKRDEAETDPFGQNVSETFPMADAFFNLDESERLQDEVSRFIDLLFGDPFHTPSRTEFGMFHAQAAALRSADLSRQVGAVVSTDDGNIIAVGTNEVPKAGGGLYWAGDDGDSRDFQLARNESLHMRRTALGEILSRLKKELGWLHESKICTKLEITPDDLTITKLIDGALPAMKHTRVMGLGEFGRTVHAEMAALMDAARRGVSVEGNSLYTTTFPCHNCTRHIIAAGIGDVVYIEPYPKSLAETLHRDSIVVDQVSRVPNRVNYRAFVGIAPSRYVEFFSMPERKGKGVSVRRWDRKTAVPKHWEGWVRPTYPAVEFYHLDRLIERMDSKGLHFTRAEA